MVYNKGVILLYLCYLIQYFSEERNDVYYDFILDTRSYSDSDYDYDYDYEYENEKTTSLTVDYEDDFNLSIYEYEDSSNYFQAITKAIFCLFH